jgi:hypothetical protein
MHNRAAPPTVSDSTIPVRLLTLAAAVGEAATVVEAAVAGRLGGVSEEKQRHFDLPQSHFLDSFQSGSAQFGIT